MLLVIYLSIGLTNLTPFPKKIKFKELEGEKSKSKFICTKVVYNIKFSELQKQKKKSIQVIEKKQI